MSRSLIIEKVKQNKPPQVALPDLEVFNHNIPLETLIGDFIKTSTGNMSSVVNIMNSQIPLEMYLKEFINENFEEGASFYNAFEWHENSQQVDPGQTAVEIFLAEAAMGVAENGCLWLDENVFDHRIAAFSCQHTILVINHKNLVPTMHQAYRKIEIDQTGYGVFIAGPSKTADIEQSLVIGAQGAVSNTVILV